MPASPRFVLVVFADVHGNLPALEAAAEDAKFFCPDAVVHGGDIVNGPGSREVVAFFLAKGWNGVMGNHEDYVLRCTSPRAPALWRSERFAPVRWARSHLSRRHLDWLAELPNTISPHPETTVVHGSPGDFRAALRSEMDDERAVALYSGLSSRVVICGHTHLPHVREIGDRLYVNAGSCGITLDGDARASYAVLTQLNGSWCGEIRRVEYDTRQVLDLARRTSWLEEGGGVSATMVHEMMTGISWTTPFVRWWTTQCRERTSVDSYREFARMRGMIPLL